MRRPGRRDCRLIVIGMIALLAAGCSGSSNGPASAPSEVPATLAAASSAAARASATRAPFAAAQVPGILASPPASSASATATSTPPLSQLQLAQAALQVNDLPAGFVLTSSGPGGPELGRDILASYQGEFQQRDVTSPQSLQQTIVIIDLLGSYRDSIMALSATKAVSVQSLNQLLGGVNLTAEPANVPVIEEDSSGFHFSGDTGGASVGGFMVVFHRGPTAALVVTAAIKGSESLPQTVDLAQKQAQKIRGGT